MSAFDENTEFVIDRMIFHVVGLSKDSPPVYLEEITPIVHGQFFVDRIKETIAGNKVRFQESSPTKASLQNILRSASSGDAAAVLSTESRYMAERFNGVINGSGSATPGVFLIIELSCDNRRFYTLIKYDHEDVITYDLMDREGRNYVTLKEITTTFVKKKKAMQKSAFLVLEDDSECYVIDRSEPKGITDYFKNFLGVDRCFNAAQLTDKFRLAVEETVKKGVESGLIDKSVKRNYKTNLYALAQSGADFNPESPAETLSAIIGPDANKSEVVELFKRQLRSHKIDGERFGFESDIIQKPTKLRTRTADGVVIEYNDDHEHTGLVQKGTYEGKPSIIIDISRGLVEDAYQISQKDK